MTDRSSSIGWHGPTAKQDAWQKRCAASKNCRWPPNGSARFPPISLDRNEVCSSATAPLERDILSCVRGGTVQGSRFGDAGGSTNRGISTTRRLRASGWRGRVSARRRSSRPTVSRCANDTWPMSYQRLCCLYAGGATDAPWSARVTTTGDHVVCPGRLPQPDRARATPSRCRVIGSRLASGPIASSPTLIPTSLSRSRRRMAVWSSVRGRRLLTTAVPSIPARTGRLEPARAADGSCATS